MIKKLLALVLVSGLKVSPLYGQTTFAGLEHLFTTPKQYQAIYTARKPVIDGDINDPAWQSVSWTEQFTDIEGDKRPKPVWTTRVKMVWSDSALFIAAELDEPHVWATLKQHDEIVYYDNDFEVFIDPDQDTHHYFEIEVNAINTIFDLLLPKPYRNGGDAMISWHVDKLRSAVKVNGTLNNPADIDKGWTVEMAIPFWALTIGNNRTVPEHGTLWRINFSRVEWDTDIQNGKYVKRKDANGRNLPEHNWVWSPQGVINMHYPERWGYLQFVHTISSGSIVLPYSEQQKHYLWLIYYRQKQYHEKYGKYAAHVSDLQFTSSQVIIDKQINNIFIEATTHQFIGKIQGQDKVLWCINQDGFVQKIPQTH
ncbi:carbohydrate-binding family 9-like protein [Cytophagaceae bacterium DM2B3-1]|uniref:Carbohydrate-binding family 9-like protein n=1 Tax=Xanthocytophaga flava TaxID=3048013 RepID=A0ABT7CNP0_9BACT|nr:carbohydrate-binding family 9-like protein [Xanthocytophaga flavus]MDJ1495353.1 carbohydrate-binding family 9-like protein [Xanthocytophaga flavus]